MWQEKLNREIQITTGDGSVFECLYQVSSKTLEFNTAVFEFINKKKSFVDRRNPKSRKMTLEFIFQGDDHIEMSERFEKASEDSRFWVVNHPSYGIIYGHPLSIEFTTASLNSTEIVVEFVETITDEAGITESNFSKENPIDKYNELTENATQAFQENNVLTGEDRKSFVQNITDISNAYQSLYYGEEMQEVQQRIRQVSQAVNAVVANPERFVRDLYSFVGYIADLKTSIFQKIDTCEQIYADFKSVIEQSSGGRKYFESSGASLVGTMALSILNITDVSSFSRKNLLSIAERVNNLYNDYMQTLEENEVKYENYKNTFALDFTVQNSLYSLVVFSIYRLMNLIYNARQERILELEKDSNIIVLTHRFIGLDENDQNIELFRGINEIKNKNLFIIPKGTKIRYYI